MTKIILKIELGDWDGGHNGRYPKIIEWNLDDENYPIEESEGWGHGLGGSRASLNNFIKSNCVENLKGEDSDWAYEIIIKAFELNKPIREIGQALSIESQNCKILLPEHLRAVLGRWGCYLNA
ncbi:hypothetical protein [Motiliproteus sediminis]|uniref:hypothetical protein n=1 Tax=Motiliproteus sediminis TaxID=1468178 RepID=UPI001AEFC87F|nr:hypothetical protein [Motiliproteus sediminis]